MRLLKEDWDTKYPAFESLTDQYMPVSGAGDTMLSGLLVASNKLIYRWYNDGDVFDNSENGLEGFANDISGSANWVYRYGTSKMKAILDTVHKCYSDDEYEYLIERFKKALEDFANQKDLVEQYLSEPLKGDPYDENGPFSYSPYQEEEDEDYYDEDEDEEGYW